MKRKQPPKPVSKEHHPLYDTVIVGGGPAGLGAIVSACQSGTLQILLDQKICVIESGSSIGGGDLGNYAINSDTPGGVLLECFTEKNTDMFKTLFKFPATNTLRDNDNKHVPLKLIGEFLTQLCRKTFITAKFQHYLSK